VQPLTPHLGGRCRTVLKERWSKFWIRPYFHLSLVRAYGRDLSPIWLLSDMARRVTHSTYTSPSFGFPLPSASTAKAAVMFGVLITLSNIGITSATPSPDLSFPSLADFPPPPPPLDSGMPSMGPLDPADAEHPSPPPPFEDHRRGEHAARSGHRHSGLARRLQERASKARRTSESSRSVSRQISHKTYTLVDSFEEQSFFE
jgi:hypothetical protein